MVKRKNSALVARVIEFIANRPRTKTYQAISLETGVQVQFIQDLMTDRLKSPGAERIEALYDYFAPASIASLIG